MKILATILKSNLTIVGYVVACSAGLGDERCNRNIRGKIVARYSEEVFLLGWMGWVLTRFPVAYCLKHPANPSPTFSSHLRQTKKLRFIENAESV